MVTEQSDQTRLAELEEDIRRIDGVISAVVFNDTSGNPVEIQAFVRGGTSEGGVRSAIRDILTRRGKVATAERVFVFELAGHAATHPPRIGSPNVEGATASWEAQKNGEMGESTPAQTRPRIGRISLDSFENISEASVSLVYQGREAEGLGRARKTPYSLRLTAAATLEAVQALLGEQGLYALEGVSLLEVLKQQIVLVLVHSAANGGQLLLGASLLKGGPAYQATVKATLDAVNRQLENAFGR